MTPEELSDLVVATVASAVHSGALALPADALPADGRIERPRNRDHGDWASSVPSWCTFDMRVGVLPSQTLKECRQEVEDTIRQAAAAGRLELLKLASAKLGEPIEKLTVTDGVVSVAGDASRKVSYGELIGGKQFNGVGGHEDFVAGRMSTSFMERYNVARPAGRLARKELHDFHPRLLRHADLGEGGAAREVRDLSTVAEPRNRGVEGGADDEIRPLRRIEGRRRLVHNRAGPKDHRGVLTTRVLDQGLEDIDRVIPPVGELEHRRAPGGTGRDHTAPHGGVRVVEDGNQGLVDDTLQDVQSGKASHT